MTRFKYQYPLCIALVLVIVSLTASEVSKAFPEKTFVYVSNGDDGDISVIKLDEETGKLSMLEKVPAGPKVMHMTLSPDQKFIYASIRSEQYSVISYSINLD